PSPHAAPFARWLCGAVAATLRWLVALALRRPTRSPRRPHAPAQPHSTRPRSLSVPSLRRAYSLAGPISSPSRLAPRHASTEPRPPRRARAACAPRAPRGWVASPAPRRPGAAPHWAATATSAPVRRRATHPTIDPRRAILSTHRRP